MFIIYIFFQLFNYVLHQKFALISKWYSVISYVQLLYICQCSFVRLYSNYISAGCLEQGNNLNS